MTNHPAALPPHCGHAHSLAVTTPPPAMSRMLLGLKGWLTFALKSPGVGISPSTVVYDNHQLILLPHCGHAHSLQQWPHLPLPWHVYCLDCRSSSTFALKSPGIGVSLKPLACDNHPDPPPHSGHAQSLRQWPRLPVSCHVYC